MITDDTPVLTALFCAAMWMYVLALVVLYYVVRWFRELERVPDKGSKYVYITGCDSGFGNLLARHLDKCGFCVVAACFTEKGEEELKKCCSSRMSTVHLDVRKQESIDKAAAFIKERVGQKGGENTHKTYGALHYHHFITTEVNMALFPNSILMFYKCYIYCIYTDSLKWNI